MKIGIFTFHRALNYGAFLQAFSLKRYLTEIGHQVDVVDYWPQEHVDMYRFFSAKWMKNRSIVGKLKYLLNCILRYSRVKRRSAKMNRLQIHFLGILPQIKYSSSKELAGLQYDCFVYGSDQIWWKWNNLPDGKYDWTYWGDYVGKNVRKISYAASMGVISPNEDEKKQIALKLKNFQSISVRESGLKNFIQPLTDKPVCQVIDPVFLTSKIQWEQLAVKPKIAGKYVLLFNLMNSPDAEIVAKRKSDELQCPLIEITASVNSLKFGRNIYQTLDAFEFIGFIKNAEFVVTSSFHGTAFSVIFEKEFYSVGFKNNSGRVTSLLTSLKLNERFLVNSNLTQTFAPIDYGMVSNLLNLQINESKEYLDWALAHDAK